MSQQIKKKYLGPNSVDGSKIKLLQNESLKGVNDQGQDVDLLKISPDGKVLSTGKEIAFKEDLTIEELARIAGDEDLQSAVDVEKGRIDAILSASDADKDSFAEIVQLINSVDTENNSAFAGYVLSNNAALAAEESARIAADSAEESRAMAAESDLQYSINVQGLSLLSTIDFVNSGLQSEITRAEAVEGVLTAAVSAEESARIAGDEDLQSAVDVEKGRIDAILSASDADKDSFAEIVQLINSVDTENNSAFAGYVLSNNAALAAEESARIAAVLFEETARVAGDSAEQTRAMGVESSLQSQVTQEISDRQSANSTEQTARIAGDADLQAQHDDLDGYAQDVRSDLDQEIVDRAAAVSAEASARQSADSSLQSSLSSEISRAQSAESTEQAARIAGDSSTLQSSKDYTDGKISLVMSNLDTEALDSLVEVVTAFQNADSNLNNTISSLSSSASSGLATEQAARIAADQTLQFDLDAAEAAISSEVMRATGVEGGIDSRLVTAENEINTLQFDLDAAEAAISSEVMRATGVEGGIDSRLVTAENEINTLQFDLDAAEAAISSEVMRATGVEGGLNSRLGTAEGEIVTIKSDLITSAAAISAEIMRATGVEGSLQSQINNALSNLDGAALDSLTEIVSAFQAADSTLNGAITSLASSASSSLSTEQSARIAADSALQGEIDAEESSRAAADTTLQNNINSEAASRIAQDSVLSGEISALSLDVDNLDGYAQDIRNDLDSLQSAFDAQVDGPSFNKMKVVIGSELGFIDLAHSAIANSIVVCVGRLMAHKDEDFTLSVVGGVSRLTWIGSMANPSGEEKIETGDNVFATYAY